ncbi:MAG: LysR family transcriptional regulator [Desulfobacterales bacterium]|nr:LysR family transcriptional regulator [Desulfobacterales bacterium]
MLPDLNRLKVFYHVYTANSIIKAAEALYITQPAVSQQIKKLEAEIKAPLFIRQHKKIIPTQAAHRLFNTVNPFLEGLACEIENISTPMDRPCGPLNIGAPIIFGTTYLPDICHEFRTAYPEVRFSVTFGESDELLERLNTGELDLIMIDYFSPLDQMAGGPEQYSIKALMQEQFILACSRDYYDTRVKGDASLDHLKTLEYLTDENHPTILRHWFWYYFKKSVTGLNIVMAIAAHQALMACIRNGMGVAITSHHLFAGEIDAGEIVPVFPSSRKLVNTISTVTLKGAVPTMTQKVFQSFLEDRFHGD